MSDSNSVQTFLDTQSPADMKTQPQVCKECILTQFWKCMILCSLTYLPLPALMSHSNQDQNNAK